MENLKNLIGLDFKVIYSRIADSLQDVFQDTLEGEKHYFDEEILRDGITTMFEDDFIYYSDTYQALEGFEMTDSEWEASGKPYPNTGILGACEFVNGYYEAYEMGHFPFGDPCDLANEVLYIRAGEAADEIADFIEDDAAPAEKVKQAIKGARRLAEEA